MEKNGTELNSALSAIARHERELLGKAEENDREAERLIAHARVEAAHITENEAQRLAAEVARIRKEAEEAREQERLQHLRDIENRLAQLRADARKRAREAVRAVVSLVLPASTRGSR